MRNLLIGLGLLMAPFLSSAQLTAKGLKASNGTFIGFYQYTPTNYTSTTTKYPVIIFLHGVGERGNGTTDLPRIAGPAIPGYIRNKGWNMTFTWMGKTETFIVLAPQLSTSYGSWQDFYVDEMLKYAKANLRIDPNRIFLTGLSLGGGGVWHYASSSLTHAQEFAGIAPVCGTCAVVNASNMAAGTLPVWAFHASNDGTVGVGCTTGAIANINKSNPAVTPMMTIYPDGAHGIWDKAYSNSFTYQNPTIYEWMLAQNKSYAPNKKPVPRAGTNLSITTALGSVSLNATSSSDPDGSIVRTIWRQLSGPKSGLISLPSSLATIISGLTTAGTYQFELEVVDNRAEWAKDTISVAVSGGTITTPPPAPTTGTPTARAGNDITITLPTSSTTLDGSGSSTPSGSLTSFAWSKVSGPSQGSIGSPAAARTSISNLAQGTYYFRLQVTNSGGVKDADTVKVVVNGSTTSTNTPTARAGNDVTIALPSSSTNLDGSYSSTPSGTLTSFAWSKVSGPSQGSIGSPAAARTSVSNLAQGTYYFRLQVTNSGGVKDADTVKVVVNSSTTTSTNKPPVARAGSDVTITLPLNYTTLDGKWSSDPEKAIKYFKWTKASGPTQYSLTNKSTNWAVCGVSNLVQGTYSFQLEVTDAAGLKSTDLVNVIVKSSTTSSSSMTAAAMEMAPIKDTVIVSPNPVSSSMTVNFTSSQTGKLTINIYDINGRVLSTTSALKSGTQYLQTYNVSNYANGTYVVGVITEDRRTFTAKFLKQ